MKKSWFFALLLLLPLVFVSCNDDDDDADYYFCSFNITGIESNASELDIETQKFVTDWVEKIGIALSNCYLPQVTEKEALRRYSVGYTNLETLVSAFNQEVEQNKEKLSQLEFSYNAILFYAKESDPTNHIKEQNISFRKTSYLLPSD